MSEARHVPCKELEPSDITKFDAEYVQKESCQVVPLIDCRHFSAKLLFPTSCQRRVPYETFETTTPSFSAIPTGREGVAFAFATFGLLNYDSEGVIQMKFKAPFGCFKTNDVCELSWIWRGERSAIQEKSSSADIVWEIGLRNQYVHRAHITVSTDTGPGIVNTQSAPVMVYTCVASVCQKDEKKV
jgi:hypothetical protein